MCEPNPKIIAVWLRDDDQYCGLPIQSIPLPECCYFLGVLRNEGVVLASENPVLGAKDLMIAIAINPMLAPALLAALKEHLPIDRWLETTSVCWSNTY